eukprot:2729684-Rhodomonas_salina.1
MLSLLPPSPPSPKASCPMLLPPSPPSSKASCHMPLPPAPSPFLSASLAKRFAHFSSRSSASTERDLLRCDSEALGHGWPLRLVSVLFRQSLKEDVV